MCDPDIIIRLYKTVLYDHKNKYSVNKDDIQTAIKNMVEVYKPNPDSLSDSILYVADYNDASHRIAYLHKYAPFHTALVAEMLGRALHQNPNLFQDLVQSAGGINICSLGGGPGSDIFGVLSVLNEKYGPFPVFATLIDCMENWKDIFYELINELRNEDYGFFGDCVSEQYFDWKYLQHNLLTKMNGQVNQAVGRANLVTMVKFVSASSCKDSSAMIKKIFKTMKPGSLVLYIDNAGGGFHQMVRKEAHYCNMETVFGPLKHELYRNESFSSKRFDYTPCFETKVTVQIWRKTSRNFLFWNSNEPSTGNVFPNVHKVNNPKTTQNYHPGPRKPNSRANQNFNSSEPSSNRRPRNFPNASTHSVYDNDDRTTYSHSYLPEDQGPATNRNFNARNTGHRSYEYGRQIPVQSQPWTTTSDWSEAQRNDDFDRLVEDENEENDDCRNCCVIS